nr:MAG TPA: Protein SSO2, Exocyst complex component, coiled-coil, Sec3, Sso2, structural [Caudoviricetes sp.]
MIWYAYKKHTQAHVPSLVHLSERFSHAVPRSLPWKVVRNSGSLLCAISQYPPPNHSNKISSLTTSVGSVNFSALNTERKEFF